MRDVQVKINQAIGEIALTPVDCIAYGRWHRGLHEFHYVKTEIRNPRSHDIYR